MWQSYRKWNGAGSILLVFSEGIVLQKPESSAKMEGKLMAVHDQEAAVPLPYKEVEVED